MYIYIYPVINFQGIISFAKMGPFFISVSSVSTLAIFNFPKPSLTHTLHIKWYDIQPFKISKYLKVLVMCYEMKNSKDIMNIEKGYTIHAFPQFVWVS